MIRRIVESHRGLLWILLVALLLRVGLIGAMHTNGYTPDEREYVYLASKLANDEPFIDSNGEWSTRAPLFPYLMSFWFRWFGEGLILLHIVGCILGTGIVALGYRLCLGLWGERTPALICSAVLALYPGLVIYATLLQNETVYILFLLLALVAAIRLGRECSWITIAAVGILSGLASLTRAVYVGFFPLLILAIGGMRWKEQPRGARRLVVAIILWAVVLAPWTTRNYDVHGTFMPVSSGGGRSLLTGNNPHATGTWRTAEGFDAWFQEQANMRGTANVHTLNEVERSTLSSRIAVDYALAYPADVLALALEKAFIFWVYPITNSDSNIPMQAVAVAADVPLLLFAGFGMVLTWKDRKRLLPLYVAMLFFFFVQVVLHSEARFRLPLVPILAVFAASALGILADRAKRSAILGSGQVRLALGGVSAAVVAIYAYTGFLFLTGSIS